MKRLFVLCLGAAITLGACFGGSPQPRYFALEPPTPARSPGAPYPYTVLVRRFDTALAYDRLEIVYRPREHEVRFYEYRLWIAKPGRMLSEVVATHIDALGLFEAVTLRSSERPADYELRGEVLSIDELDERSDAAPSDPPAKGWRARLGLKLTLSSLDTGVVVWEHTFEVEREVAKQDPQAVVATLVAILGDELGRAMAELDRTFARLTTTTPRLGERGGP